MDNPIIERDSLPFAPLKARAKAAALLSKAVSVSRSIKGQFLLPPSPPPKKKKFIPSEYSIIFSRPSQPHPLPPLPQNRSIIPRIQPLLHKNRQTTRTIHPLPPLPLSSSSFFSNLPSLPPPSSISNPHDRSSRNHTITCQVYGSSVCERFEGFECL